MKSLFQTYTTVILVAILATFSACDKETIEPMQAANPQQNLQKASDFAAGNYIVQFQDDSTLNLITDQDIILLAQNIAKSPLTVPADNVFNFEGFQGFTGYLTKQQARNFYYDARVFVIEPDGPIIPLNPITEPAPENELQAIN